MRSVKSSDHPHGCGENAGKGGGVDSGENRSGCSSTAERTIPTGVGKTLFAPVNGSGFLRSDHPHGCGENSLAARRQYSVPPDHPHGCGENLHSSRHNPDTFRTIPTGVGKTPSTWRESSTIAPDHPHGCGENYKTLRSRCSRSAGVGPSPRVWGKRSRCCKLDFGGHVADHPHGCGENVLATRRKELRNYADHPHGCGENRRPPSLRNGQLIGPSPRVWGKHDNADAQPRDQCGPSPRVWGKLGLDHGSDAILIRDHPHGCGENDDERFELRTMLWGKPMAHRGPSPRVWGKRHFHMPDQVVRKRGPSPRVWGKPPPCIVERQQIGPSPRVWGKRVLRAFSEPLRPDHPHGCGENTAFATTYISQNSHSPVETFSRTAIFPVPSNLQLPTTDHSSTLPCVSLLHANQCEIPDNFDRSILLATILPMRCA